jgi:hypothetical protein
MGFRSAVGSCVAFVSHWLTVGSKLEKSRRRHGLEKHSIFSKLNIDAKSSRSLKMSPQLLKTDLSVNSTRDDLHDSKPDRWQQ